MKLSGVAAFSGKAVHINLMYPTGPNFFNEFRSHDGCCLSKTFSGLFSAVWSPESLGVFQLSDVPDFIAACQPEDSSSPSTCLSCDVWVKRWAAVHTELTR